MKKKIALTLLILVLAAGMLFAGGEQGGPTTLRFSWWGTDARHEATLAAIAAFERANPSIKIEPEYGSQDGYNAKKTTEFASRTAPDLMQIETGAGPEYQRLGVLYNLSNLSYIKFDKFDPNFLKANGQFGTGSQYAIPTGMAGTALTVNKTLADKLGIDMTKQYDWDQLIVWGQQVRAADPSCYLLSVNTQYGMDFFVRAHARQLIGGPIIDDAGKRLNITEAQFTQIFDFIDRMYKSGTSAPASYKAPFNPNDQTDPNWIAGKYVAHVGYTSTAEVVQAANPSVQYIAGRLPLDANGKGDGWYNDCPQFMGIYALTKYPEMAAKFFDFFFNTEEAARILGTVRTIPPTAMAQKIVVDEKIANPLTVEATAMSASYSGLSEQQSGGSLTTNQEVQDILRNLYEEVAYGRMIPAQAAGQAMQRLNAFLARQ